MQQLKPLRAGREEISLGITPAISHYTDAVRFGDLLFISGIVAIDADLEVVSDDVAEQADYIFDVIGRIMAKAGAGFADVLRVTVYLLDVADRTRINPVRQKYFGDARPASTLIGVRELALPGLKIEVEAVVGLPASA
ncbi:RidA family protein [Zavarzinia compransoris]|uniref:RidA family protein n=1 Tax=Zavarzinia marina TaxID=2911065 RepID=UPI001F1A055A|nr:RidA family protein [Zavarzinia marina]MCF4167361.1 RidA family protein [Zavarzinia marina]